MFTHHCIQGLYPAQRKMCKDSELPRTQTALSATHNATWLAKQFKNLYSMLPHIPKTQGWPTNLLKELRGKIWTIADLQKEVISM